MGTFQGQPSGVKNLGARVAFIYIDDESDVIMRESFRQAGIECVSVDSPEQLVRRKFEGCVIALDHPEAGPALEMLRKSPSNSRLVVLGIEKTANVGLKHLRYGVSVVLTAPLDRRTAVKAVRSTRSLLLNEFRRYVRIPVALEIAVNSNIGYFSSYTEEVSGGGLSLKIPNSISFPTGNVRVSFGLPGDAKVSLEATVCWQKTEERTIGLRFEEKNPNRRVIRDWIESYLQLA